MDFDPRPLLDWIALHPGWAALAVFVTAFLESLALVGLVMPGSLMMFGFGAMIALGALPLWPTLWWAFLGALAGDGVSFWLGRRYGERLHGMWPLRRHPGLLARGEAFFRHHGGKGVLLGRFVGPLRPVIPAVAGMMGMALPRFLAFNLASALLWAPAYLLPGIALGASLALAAEVAGRLALLLFLLMLLLSAVWWLSHRLFLLLQPRAAAGVRGAMAWGAAHPRLGRLTAALVDPAHPEPLGLALLALILLAALTLFAWLLRGALGGGVPGFDEGALLALFQELRSPWAERLMVTFTELGDGAFIALYAVPVALWLWLKGERHALWYLLAALAFAALVPSAIKLLTQVERPPGAAVDGFSFPSAHAAHAAIVYGFVAALVARGTPLAWRWLPYAVGSTLVAGIAFSRLYLGVHWPSDVVGGLALGAAWTALLAIAYGRHNPRPPAAVPLAGVALGGLLLVALPYVAWRHGDDLARYAPHREERVVAFEAWRDGVWRQLPGQLTDLRGRPRQVLGLQWAAPLAEVERRLGAAGWRPAAELTAAGALLWLSPEVAVERLPLPPRVHAGRHEALRLISPDGGRLLRLWPSESRLADGRPLWLGSVRALRVAHPVPWLRYPRAEGEALPPEAGLGEALSGWHVLRRDDRLLVW